MATYGRSAAEQLLRFNDAYYGFYEVYLQLKANGSGTAYLKDAERSLEDMRKYLGNLSVELPDQPRLLSELRNYLERQEKRMAELTDRSS